VDPRHPPALLRALDGLVRDDGAPVRFSGNVVVAVKAKERAWVWYARFYGERLVGTGYLEGLPPDADAVLLFDEVQAGEAVEGRMPAGKVPSFGQRELLEAFIERFLSFKSAIDVRAGSGS
jgi:hypothetical protein